MATGANSAPSTAPSGLLPGPAQRLAGDFARAIDFAWSKLSGKGINHTAPSPIAQRRRRNALELPRSYSIAARTWSSGSVDNVSGAAGHAPGNDEQPAMHEVAARTNAIGHAAVALVCILIVQHSGQRPIMFTSTAGSSGKAPMQYFRMDHKRWLVSSLPVSVSIGERKLPS